MALNYQTAFDHMSGISDNISGDMDGIDISVEIGVLRYEGAQAAAVLGMTDLLAAAAGIAPQRQRRTAGGDLFAPRGIRRSRRGKKWPTAVAAADEGQRPGRSAEITTSEAAWARRGDVGRRRLEAGGTGARGDVPPQEGCRGDSPSLVVPVMFSAGEHDAGPLPHPSRRAVLAGRSP